VVDSIRNSSQITRSKQPGVCQKRNTTSTRTARDCERPDILLKELSQHKRRAQQKGRWSSRKCFAEKGCAIYAPANTRYSGIRQARSQRQAKEGRMARIRIADWELLYAFSLWKRLTRLGLAFLINASLLRNMKISEAMPNV
jgi:hypothetical protein